MSNNNNETALSDHSSMIRDNQHPSEPPSLEHHPEVSRARNLLLILIGIDLVIKKKSKKKRFSCLSTFDLDSLFN